MKKYLIILLSCLYMTPLFAQSEEGTAYFRDTQAEPSDSTVHDSFICIDSIAALSPDTLPYPQDITRRLDKLLSSPMFQSSQVGLMVFDLTADSCIYRHHERQTMRPASTQKLVTAITAIDRLGGSYQFRTSLFHTGRIESRTLTGDLICVGGMDPAFSHDDMHAFVESLRRLDIDTIRGCILADRSFKDENLLGEGWCWDDDNPVLSPLLFNKKDDFVEQLAKALSSSGITLLPQPAGTKGSRQPVCTRTHTIDQILTRMMKDSDNLYAESMFYQTGASGTQTSKASLARQKTQQLIQKVGLLPANYKIADGSGLSLYNYVTPELHVRLLRYAWYNKNILEHLLPALPIAGVDGTLRNRMKGTVAAGNVRAKTGTVTCISALAGYCTATNGHDLCFSIINQGIIRIADGRSFQDQVCRVLCGDTLAKKPSTSENVRRKTAVATKAPAKQGKAKKNSKNKSKKKKWKR